MKRNLSNLSTEDRSDRQRQVDAAAHRRSRGSISAEDFSAFVAGVDLKLNVKNVPTATDTVKVGKVFGRLTVKSFEKNRWNQTVANCLCSCGKTSKPNISNLASGETKSCGCLRLSSDFTGKRLVSSIKTTYKARAKKIGISFNLDHPTVKRLVLSNCVYCGVEPYRAWSLVTKGGVESLKCNGIDRVNNELGYELNNVVPCCPRCNYAKRDMSFQEFSAWALRLANHLQKQYVASAVDMKPVEVNTQTTSVNN